MADNAQTLRERAAYCRALAQHEPNAETSRGLVEVAEEYEARAAEIEAHPEQRNN